MKKIEFKVDAFIEYAEGFGHTMHVKIPYVPTGTTEIKYVWHVLAYPARHEVDTIERTLSKA